MQLFSNPCAAPAVKQPIPGHGQLLLGCVTKCWGGWGWCDGTGVPTVGLGTWETGLASVADWALMLIHLLGGTAFHLQQLRPAVILICLLIIFYVLQGKKKKEREIMNEEVGVKFAAWQNLQLGSTWGNKTTAPHLLQGGR